MLSTMKSKLFNSLLDLLLDIIVWLVNEKEDHPAVPLPNPTDPNPKKTHRLVAADGFIGQEGIKMAAKQPKSNYYRALYRIDR
jgi:hypothetical protein